MRKRQSDFKKVKNNQWYDLFEDWELIEASFTAQYGIRLRTETDMTWDEFCTLLSGIMPKTPLGQIVSIRSEEDENILKNFTEEQHKIRNEWRGRQVEQMTDEEKEEVKSQVKFYKNIRKTIQFGDLYRLKSAFDSNEAAWMNISKDGNNLVVSYVKKYAEANVLPKRLKLKALDENSLYEISETGEVFGGDELMYIGLEIGELNGDYQARSWTLRRIQEQ